MIVMAGTARGGASGVASVIATYAAHGLFQRWPVVRLTSHVVGSKWQKLAAIIDVLSNDEQYARMSRAACARFAHDYSADVVMPKLERLYAELGATALARVA